MTENDTCEKKPRSKMSLRSLRLSLKYRPELLKLILKMRQCIRKRNSLLKSLKQRLKKLVGNEKTFETDKGKVIDTATASNLSEKDDTTSESVSEFSRSITSTKPKNLQDSSTQTYSQTYSNVKDQDDKLNDQRSEDCKRDSSNEKAGWNLKENGDSEKSIAEQVKEAAQSALQDTGMVYVESAGMYYDYKTGYYYNSELGLYYHSDTGCYYYYSDDKKFVFHSYPDMSKVNSSLIAHQNKKAKKLKRGKEEDGSNPKKPRKSTKTKKEKKGKRKDKKPKENNENNLKQEIMEGIEEKNEETEEKLDKIDIPAESSSTKDENTNIEDMNIPNETKSLEDSEHEKNSVLDIFEINDNSDVKTKHEGENGSNKIDNVKNDSEKEDNDGIESKVESEIKDQDTEEVKKEEMQELEDGECSETESEDSESESDASTSTVSDEDSIAKQHPPCMRVIVRETKLPKLKVGSLFLITKDGGTIGREGEQHAILLKDHNVSRNHLDVRYDVVKKTYLVTDLGSKNGTILNGVRMSESQEISLPLDVLHGSTIQLGETKLLCHIHPGHSTCGQCEPGLLMKVEEEKKAAYTRTVSVKKQHELELARLKNIYVPHRLAIEEKPYNDRAQARREAVGSTNHAEKTQSTDLDTSITPENKGFKLLQKMGWSKGEGLGKDSQGDTEPVPLISNDGKAGLGTTGAVAPPSNTPKPRVVKNNLAAATMRLATRTKMLQPPAKVFQNEDEEEFE